MHFGVLKKYNLNYFILLPKKDLKKVFLNVIITKNKKERVNKMNKTQLIEAVAAKANIKKKDAEIAINSLVDVITDSLVNGEKIQLTGFGSFDVKERAAHDGINPFTKETMHYDASKKPVFSPSKALKDAVNG